MTDEDADLEDDSEEEVAEFVARMRALMEGHGR